MHAWFLAVITEATLVAFTSFFCNKIVQKNNNKIIVTLRCGNSKEIQDPKLANGIHVDR